MFCIAGNDPEDCADIGVKCNRKCAQYIDDICEQWYYTNQPFCAKYGTEKEARMCSAFDSECGTCYHNLYL